MPASNAPSSQTTDTTLAVDHIGIVVRDLAREVAKWRQDGFSVSEPVPLMGVDAAGRPQPLGQSSSHVVFDNFYVELSSPVPDSGNHLEPYLQWYGEGVRILVVAAADVATAHAACAARWPETSPVRSASRDIVIAATVSTARFLWFPLPVDIVPGALSAVVQHVTPELVFHPGFVTHANGLRHVARVIVRGRADDLILPPRFGGECRRASSLAISTHAQRAEIDELVFSDGRGREEKYRMARDGG